MSNRCKTCIYFVEGYYRHPVQGEESIAQIVKTPGKGVCTNPKLPSDYVCDWIGRECPDFISDGLVASDGEGRGGLTVGSEFGCIHHTPA